MIYTKETKKAMKLCFEVHKDQVDKAGLPYVFHPFHLAEQMCDESTTVVALLHDVVEDSEYTFEDLEKMGFSNKVVEALKLLTHDKTVPYMTYIEQLNNNIIARKVKLADLIHNSAISRLDSVGEKDKKRIEKYSKAIAYLREEEKQIKTKK